MNKIKILFIDDSDNDTILLIHEIKKSNFDIDSIRIDNKDDLLNVIQRNWDIVFIDYSIPGFSGIDALKLIKQIKPHLPCIMISGVMGEEKAVECMRSGANDYLIKDNYSRLVPAIKRELKERKIYQEKIEHENEIFKLSNIIDKTPFNIIITNLNGIINYCNKSFIDFSSKTKSQLIGSKYWVFEKKYHNEDDYKWFKEKIFSGKPWQEDFKKQKKGKILWLKISINAIFDKKNKIQNFFILEQDVTDEKELEMKFRQSQKMEALGQLVGGMTHDFNNLLTVISGYSDILLSKFPKDHTLRNSVKQISAASKRAKSLTSQLLAFSRKQILEPKIINTNKIISSTIKMMKRLISEDIILDIDIDENLKKCKVDPGQLEQVIMNLCINARDALPSGGLLSISTKNVYLNKELHKDIPNLIEGNYIQIKITDNGIGMSQATQNRIFEPFFTTKKNGKGTGLGLSTVYGIIKQSKGYIQVNSSLNKGTEFKIFLPASEDKEKIRNKNIDEKKLLGSETILLVEDDESIRELLTTAFKRYGYHLYTASDGQVALNMIKQIDEKIDMLVTDIIMPKINGNVLAEKMKRDNPDLLVLFISGYSDNLQTPLVQFSQEDYIFLQKPFSHKKVILNMRKLLDK